MVSKIQPKKVSIRTRCMEEIRKKPGILRKELYTMNIGHRSGIGIHVSRLIYSGKVVRIHDDIMRSDRLYPKGKEPPFNHNKIYRKSLFSQSNRNPIPKDVYGDKFYMAFDEAFGLLYIDLKILGMGLMEQNNG